jgi:AraC-like DNA-binding protein
MFPSGTLLGMANGPEYREWEPGAVLSRHVACLWTGRLGDDGTPFTDSVLPDGCIDIIWDGERLFVAGPDTGPVPIAHRAGGSFVGVRFRPALAPTFLGVPAAELLDRRVDAADVLGQDVSLLVERLAEAGSLRSAALALESALIDRLPDASPPDRLVEAAAAALGASFPPSVASMADRFGVSERQLHRRCTAAVGYGPKMLARVLRFRRFLALATAGEGPPALGLAGLAAAAGYADQAHLTRECTALAGATPRRLVGSRLAPAT